MRFNCYKSTQKTSKHKGCAGLHVCDAMRLKARRDRVLGVVVQGAEVKFAASLPSSTVPLPKP